MTTHYAPGDLVTYFNLQNDPPRSLYSGMVVRQATAAELADSGGAAADVDAPAYFVAGLGDTVEPDVRVSGDGYQGQTGPMTLVGASWIVTVVKASGDTDSIAGLLT